MNKKAVKVCLIIFSSSAAIAVSAFLGISYFTDLNNYKSAVFAAAEKETGLKISCEKAELKKAFSPFLKLQLYHTGALLPDDTKFIQVKEANIYIKTLPLLLKKIKIKSIELERPIVNIDAEKDYSEIFQKIAAVQNNKNFSIDKNIPLISGKNYKIKFKNKKDGKIFFLEGRELLLSSLKLDESVNIKASGAVFQGGKEFIKYDIDLLTPLDFKDLKPDFSAFKTLEDYNIKGSIYAHLKRIKNNEAIGALKINNLSFQTGGIKSTDNTAELVFKGNSAEITALLHPAGSAAAEVKGSFDFGRKKRINLNTKAHNINLENLFKITGAVSKILNIKNPFKDVSAKGMLDADFNIKSDFKTLHSEGKAEIKDASLNHKACAYPLSKINAEIDFENNEISIKKAEAFINNTPVKFEGGIKPDLNADLMLYSDALDLKTVSASFFKNENGMPFNIKQGALNFKTHLAGNLGGNFQTVSKALIISPVLQDKKTGAFINAGRGIININADKTGKYKGSFDIENFNAEYQKIPVKAAKLHFDFDEKNITAPENNVTILNSNIKADGLIKNYISEFPDIKVNLKGKINPQDAASVVKPYINLPYKTAGALNTEAEMHLAAGILSLKSKIKADKENYISYAVIQELINMPSLLNINIEADKNEILVKDVSLINDADIKAPVFKITGQIENLKEPVLNNFRISIPDAAAIASNFAGGEELSLKTDLILNGSIKSPKIRGAAKIIKLNLKKYLASVKNADVIFQQDKIEITAPDTAVNDSSFNISAEIEPDFKKGITVSNMRVNSVNIDMNTLSSLIYNEQNIFAKPFITVKKGAAAVNKFKILDIKAHDSGADFKIENGILKISNIKASAYSGEAEGSAEYDFASGFLKINMTGKNFDIRSSMRDLCGFEDNLAGTADVKAGISMITGPAALRTLAGNAEFTAKNGSMGALGKFEYYLYAKNLLYHGFMNTSLNRLAQAVSHDDTMHYARAEGKISFKDGFITAEELNTQGANMSLHVKGRHNMLLNTDELDIYGRISDEISRKLGSFGDKSLSQTFVSAASEKNNFTVYAPKEIIASIPPLYNKNAASNTFKVNIKGKTGAFNSINSFTWIKPDKRQQEIEPENNSNDDSLEEEKDKLPDFSDL